MVFVTLSRSPRPVNPGRGLDNAVVFPALQRCCILDYSVRGIIVFINTIVNLRFECHRGKLPAVRDYECSFLHH